MIIRILIIQNLNAIEEVDQRIDIFNVVNDNILTKEKFKELIEIFLPKKTIIDILLIINNNKNEEDKISEDDINNLIDVIANILLIVPIKIKSKLLNKIIDLFQSDIENKFKLIINIILKEIYNEITNIDFTYIIKFLDKLLIKIMDSISKVNGIINLFIKLKLKSLDKSLWKKIGSLIVPNILPKYKNILYILKKKPETIKDIHENKENKEIFNNMLNTLFAIIRELIPIILNNKNSILLLSINEIIKYLNISKFLNLHTNSMNHKLISDLCKYLEQFIIDQYPEKDSPEYAKKMEENTLLIKQHEEMIITYQELVDEAKKALLTKIDDPNIPQMINKNQQTIQEYEKKILELKQDNSKIYKFLINQLIKMLKWVSENSNKYSTIYNNICKIISSISANEINKDVFSNICRELSAQVLILFNSIVFKGQKLDSLYKLIDSFINKLHDSLKFLLHNYVLQSFITSSDIKIEKEFYNNFNKYQILYIIHNLINHVNKDDNFLNNENFQQFINIIKTYPIDQTDQNETNNKKNLTLFAKQILEDYIYTNICLNEDEIIEYLNIIVTDILEYKKLQINEDIEEVIHQYFKQKEPCFNFKNLIPLILNNKFNLKTPNAKDNHSPYSYFVFYMLDSIIDSGINIDSNEIKSYIEELQKATINTDLTVSELIKLVNNQIKNGDKYKSIIKNTETWHIIFNHFMRKITLLNSTDKTSYMFKEIMDNVNNNNNEIIKDHFINPQLYLYEHEKSDIGYIKVNIVADIVGNLVKNYAINSVLPQPDIIKIPKSKDNNIDTTRKVILGIFGLGVINLIYTIFKSDKEDIKANKYEDSDKRYIKKELQDHAILAY